MLDFLPMEYQPELSDYHHSICFRPKTAFQILAAMKVDSAGHFYPHISHAARNPSAELHFVGHIYIHLHLDEEKAESS